MDDLVDQIYEAALLPEFWPHALDLLAQAAGAQGAALMNFTPPSWIVSEDLREACETFFTNGMAATAVRTNRLLSSRHPGFLREIDVFAVDEYLRDPHFNDFWKPRGLGWGVATTVRSPSGDLLVYHCERAFNAGPADVETVQRLDALRPHLARAALLSARLDTMRAKASVDALGLLGLPAAIIDETGRLIAGNDLLNPLIPAVLRDFRLRLRLADAGADGLFSLALGQLSRSDLGARTVQSIPMRPRDGKPAMVIHLVPARRSGRDLIGDKKLTVIITPVETRDGPSEALLQGLFDLTPAEASLAAKVGRGMTLAEISAAHGTSSNTVRSQMKMVLQKTACRRQTDLALLLSGLSPLRAPT